MGDPPSEQIETCVMKTREKASDDSMSLVTLVPTRRQDEHSSVPPAAMSDSLSPSVREGSSVVLLSKAGSGLLNVEILGRLVE